MSKFQSLSVKEVRRETKDTVSVSFKLPEEFKDDFKFHQGQYLTLRAMINGEDVRRSYSICAATDEELRVAVKKVQGGMFSTYANEELKAGDQLDVMPPMGKFYVPLDPSSARHYALFAAGSGITPIISILKTVLKQEPDSRVTLFYGNSNFSSIIFRDELEDLKDKYLGRLRIFHIMSREGGELDLFTGRIDKEKCKSFFNTLLNIDDCDECFICGPEPMINEVKEGLKEIGMPDEQVHFELFTSPLGSLSQERKVEVPEEHKGKVSKMTVILDGAEMNFDLPYDAEPILDAALQRGADLPYSCKGGVCRTCLAKVTEGSVRMEVNYALEPGEIEEGYILSCQSHPTSDKCVVDYDVSG